jgi:hypothetical protein
MSSIFKILFGHDFMDTLESEDIVTFGREAFLISVNGLPQKRTPIDYESFSFRGYAFSELEGGDFFNLSDDEYLYLISNSRSI